jgi:hypothetical protein
MALQGNLQDLPLAELLQSLEVNRKSGAIFLYNGAEEGSVYVTSGRISHAVSANLEGEEAFYLMASWKKGRFVFEDGRPSPKRSVAREVPDMLMEAARREDEWRKIERRVPEGAVPDFTKRMTQEQMELNTYDWNILSLIDGRRSVTGIAERSGKDARLVRRVLDGLLSQDIIHFKNQD